MIKNLFFIFFIFLFNLLIFYEYSKLNLQIAECEQILKILNHDIFELKKLWIDFENLQKTYTKLNGLDKFNRVVSWSFKPKPQQHFYVIKNKILVINHYSAFNQEVYD